MANVVTYRWCYGEGVVDLCGRHASSEAVGAPLGPVVRGAHAGDCAACGWVGGVAAVGDDGRIWGVGGTRSVAEGDAVVRLGEAGVDAFLAAYDRRGLAVGDVLPGFDRRAHFDREGVFVG